MKKCLSNILLALVFIAGLGIFFYPSIADAWNRLHQSRAIASYDAEVQQLSSQDYSDAWAAARAYNETITENAFPGDAFSQQGEVEDDGYRSVLNPNGSGIMGYISLPKIGQKIPIYHGTNEAVLQIAAGHIQGTKLPIGGASNHSVIAAHRGLPSAKLFSDLDQMNIGDKFYLHILGEVFAYQVNQILPMVEKEDYEALAAGLAIVEGEDYVTLFTCTPYGINSHRMLVRGGRVEYHGEEEVKEVHQESMLTMINNDSVLVALLIISVLILLGMIFRSIQASKFRRK